MDREVTPGTRPQRPRWQVVAVAAGGVALISAGVTAAASRSGANDPEAAATVAPTATTVAATPMSAPPAVAIPAATATTAPAATTTLTTAPTPAAAPPVARRIVPPPAPLSFGQLLDAALGTSGGCLVVEENGVVAYERHPTTPFVPASAQKVMVGAALLSRLGPDFRYETKVVAPERPGPDGRLDDAWMVGAGDPFLAGPEYIGYALGKPRLATLPLTPLILLADALAAAGVRDIPGGIHGDESRYDTARSVPTWKPSYVAEAEVGSIGALTVNAGFASWGPSQRVAPDPAAAATGELTRLLGERGVTAAPPPGPAPDGRRTAPDDAEVIASVRSAPLGEMVAGMIRASDNYAAEMFLRELDRHTGGAGTTPGGAAAVVAEMAAAGVDTTGVHLNDGSGLDTGNRSTCRALVGALALSSRPGLGAVAEGLPVAGRSGTLVKRFKGTPAEGRLAAKTGWVNGAASLAGQIDVVLPRRFALILNGAFDYATARAVQAKVVTVLATTP